MRQAERQMGRLRQVGLAVGRVGKPQVLGGQTEVASQNGAQPGASQAELLGSRRPPEAPGLLPLIGAEQTFHSFHRG